MSRVGRAGLPALGGVLIMLAVAWLPGPAAATSAGEDPQAVADAIRQAVASTAPANASISVGPVMGAHYMRACEEPLSVTVTGDEPYQQATAHCTSPAWTLYVSVTVDARVAVVVTARPISGGQVVGVDDVVLRDEPISVYAGRQVFYHPEDVAGGIASMSLPTGTILTNNDVQQPLIVEAGQTIAVDIREGDLDVSLNATAEESGHVGDMIMVINPASGKRFEAKVTRSGAVVDLGP